MKTRLFASVCYVLVAASAFADSYSINIAPGLNLIANQLDNGGNTLNEIIPVAPDQSTFYKFDNASASWEVSIYSASLGSWVPGTITLNPGEGAWFQSPTNFVLQLTGVPNVPVLPLTIPSGACYLLSRQTNDVGNYTNIMGAAPTNGAEWFQWNNAEGYMAYNYSSTKGGGGWDPSEPTAAVGEAVWIAPSGGSPATLPTNSFLVYQGLLNESLGNASLTLSGNQLIVSNIGTNGQGGIEFGIQDSKNIADGAAKSQAVEAAYSPPDSSNTVPVGGYIQSQLVGTYNDITNGVLGRLTQTKAGTGNYVISADFSPLGASSYTVQAYDQGVLVAQAANQGATSLIEEPAFSTGLDFEISTNYIGWTEDFASGTSILIAGQAVTCDHLEFIPENVPMPSGVTAFNIVASQVPSLTITSANVTLLYAGFDVTSLGNVALAVSGNQLLVSNIGTNGQGGIEFGIQDSKNIADGAAKSQAVEAVYSPPDSSNTVPVGGYIQSQLVGTYNDITNGVLGRLTQTKAGTGNYVISADFSPLGASSYTVQAYDQGVLVAQAANQGATSLIEEPAFSTGLDFEISTNYIGWTEDFASGTSILIAGQAVTCDHLEFIPENVPLPSGVTGFQILASQVPSLTVNAVTVSPWLLNLSMNNQIVTLQWYGTGVLQESADLMNWTDITNASSPYSVAAPPRLPTIKFYRIIDR